MKFKSSLLTNASGSIGGMTASHNKGGLYMRARTKPVQRNSPRQQAVKAAMSYLSQTWNLALSPTERSDWDTYAKNVPLVDSLGDKRIHSGHQMYIRSNSTRFQLRDQYIAAAPSTFNLASYTPPTVTGSPVGGVIPIGVTATDDWFNTPNAFLALFASRPQNVSKNFFKSPFQLLGAIWGIGTTGLPAGLNNPTAPTPTGVTNAGGSIPLLSTVNVTITYSNQTGETAAAIPNFVALTGTENAVSVTDPGPAQPGTTLVNVYIAVGGALIRYAGSMAPGGTLIVLAPPGTNEAPAPLVNTTANQVVAVSGTSTYSFASKFTYKTPGQIFVQANACEADARYGQSVIARLTY